MKTSTRLLLTLNEGVGVPFRYRRLIAARMAAPFALSGAYSAGGTNLQIYANGRHVVAVDATNISMVWQNSRNGSDGPAITVKAALRASTAFTLGPTPIEYKLAAWTGGSDSNKRSPSIAPGAYLESDPVAISGIVAGNLLISRQHVIFASAPSNWLGNELSAYTGDETGQTGTAATFNTGAKEGIDTYVDFGSGLYYSYPDGVTIGQLNAPALILGTTATKSATVCVLNDSIGMGAGEGTGGLYIGWNQRLLAANYPWYLSGYQGSSLNLVANDATERAKRLALLDLAGVTHLIVQAITNDIAGGRTAAQALADLASLQAYCNTLPLKPRVIPCTATPRTNAANNATTTGNAERNAFNAAIRANNGVGYGYLDAALYSFASGSDFWDTTGGKGTSDGIHPNAVTHAAIAAGLSTGLAAALSVSHYSG